MAEKSSRGRKAQPSAEKPITAYDIIKDDSKILHTPAGSAVGEEMKKTCLSRLTL